MSAVNSVTSSTNSDSSSRSSEMESNSGSSGTDCTGSSEGVDFPTIENLKSCKSDEDIVGNKYDIIESIGEGGFGAVYKVKHKIDNLFYALKVVPLQCEKEEVEFSREIKILSALHHKNVVRYHTSSKLRNDDDFFERQYLCIQMEYCDKTLKDFIDGFIPTNETKKQRHKNLIEIVAGLQFIHENGVMHRDLNPKNIFLTKDGIIKIGDFGSSRQTVILISDAACGDETTAYKSLTKCIGTEKYCAPELKTGKYDKRSDLYSLGITIFEMYFSPGATEQEKAPAFHEIRSAAVAVPESFPLEMTSIIKGLLHHNPDDRITLIVAADDIKRSNTKDITVENGGTSEVPSTWEQIDELGDPSNITNSFQFPVSFDSGYDASQEFQRIVHETGQMGSAHSIGPYGDSGNNERESERYRNQRSRDDDEDMDSDQNTEEKNRITREVIKVFTGKPPKDKAHLRKVKSMIETFPHPNRENNCTGPATDPVVSQREVENMPGDQYFRNKKRAQVVKSTNDESEDAQKCCEEQQTEVSNPVFEYTHTTGHLQLNTTRLQQLNLNQSSQQEEQVNPTTNQTVQQSTTPHRIVQQSTTPHQIVQQSTTPHQTVQPGTANVHLQSVGQGTGNVESSMPVFSTVQKQTQSSLSDTQQQN